MVIFSLTVTVEGTQSPVGIVLVEIGIVLVEIGIVLVEIGVVLVEVGIDLVEVVEEVNGGRVFPGFVVEVVEVFNGGRVFTGRVFSVLFLKNLIQSSKHQSKLLLVDEWIERQLALQLS